MCRQESGDDCVLYYSRTRKLFLLKWPGVMKCNAPLGSPPIPDRRPRKEMLLKEDLLGSVWLVSEEGKAVTLRWRPSSRKVQEKLQEFEKKAFSGRNKPASGPGKSTLEGERCTGKESEIETSCDDSACRGHEAPGDGNSKTFKERFLVEKVQTYAAQRTFCVCNIDSAQEVQDLIGSQSTSGNGSISCYEGHDSATQIAVEFERNVCGGERLERGSSQENEDQTEQKPSSQSTTSVQMFGEPETDAKQREIPNGEHTGNSEVHAKSEAVLFGADEKSQPGETEQTAGQSLPRQLCYKCGKAVRRPSHLDETAFIKDIEAPFLSPSSDEAPSLRRKPFSASLFETGEADLLVSLDYLVVVIYPLLAYVYCHRTNKWRAMVFCSPVVSCCLVAGEV